MILAARSWLKAVILTDYEGRLELATTRLQKKIHIGKGQSKAILINDCPYCDQYAACSRIIMDDGKHVEQICKIRSNDLESVWLNIREDDRPAVKMGDKYGKLTVIIPQKPDEYGHPRWLCKCECGKGKIVRGASLLNGDTSSCGCDQGKHNKMSSSCRRRTIRYEDVKEQTINSEVLSAGLIKHREVSQYVCKTNQSVDHLRALVDEDRQKHELHFKGQCPECSEPTFCNDHGEQQCSSCGLIASEPAPEGTACYSPEEIAKMEHLYKDLRPQESFGQSPDKALQKLMLLDEIAMSDHIDNIRGEYYSVPFRPAEDWDFIREHGFEPGAYVEMFPPNINKANWWDRRSLPATEVLTSDFAGEEYTLYDGQQIAYVDGFLEKVLANLHRPH